MRQFQRTKYVSPRYTNHGTGLCEQVGQKFAEAIYAKAKSGSQWGNQAVKLAESAGIRFKEDVTTATASGAFTTLLSSTLYSAAVENIKNILELVFINDDLKDRGGFGAYQIPRLQPTVAVEVAEGSVVNFFDEGVDAITVTPRKVVAGTMITWEIIKRGMNDFVRFVLQNAADAVTRKLASDIVNGLAAGAGSTAGAGTTYDKVIDAQVAVEGAKRSNGVPFGFLATHVVFSPEAWGIISKSADWKSHVFFATARPGDLTINAPVLKFNTMDIVVTPFLTAAETLVLDSKKAGMLVREADLETFEGELPGQPYDRQIVALMSYVLAIIYPDAISSITA